LPQFLQHCGTEEQCVTEYVQLQVRHQSAVTGKQSADVAVLLCGQQLRSLASNVTRT
jgi:predicted phage-related endonuclease